MTAPPPPRLPQLGEISPLEVEGEPSSLSFTADGQALIVEVVVEGRGSRYDRVPVRGGGGVEHLKAVSGRARGRISVAGAQVVAAGSGGAVLRGPLDALEVWRELDATPREIAYDASGRLAVIDAEGALVLFEDGDARTLADASTAPSGPSFSMNGAVVLYSARRDEERGVWLQRLGAESAPLRVSGAVVDAASPSAAPDGRLVVFSGREGDGSGRALYVASLPPRAPALQRLLGVDGGILHPAWSPSGDAIAFIKDAEAEGPARVNMAWLR